MSHGAMTDRPFPRGALLAAGALIAFSIATAGFGRLAQRDAPPPFDARIVTERHLVFVDRDDGAIAVLRAGDGSEVATVPPGTNGFLRGVMRGMARNRMLHDVGAAPPFRLVRWSDGRITLDDPETGRHIELDPFGPTNAGAFAALLGQPEGRS